MYDKYEESFYYDEPSSVNSDVSGEIVLFCKLNDAPVVTLNDAVTV